MAWQERYTPSGYWQFREIYDNGKASKWRFYVTGFCGNPGELGACHVRAIDGKRECPIDAKNRLQIDGTWHPPTSWDH